MDSDKIKVVSVVLKIFALIFCALGFGLISGFYKDQETNSMGPENNPMGPQINRKGPQTDSDFRGPGNNPMIILMRSERDSDFMRVATACYFIVLIIIIIIQLVKDGFETTVALYFLISGSIILFAAGSDYLSKTVDKCKEPNSPSCPLPITDYAAAALAMISGVLFFVDGLYTGIFSST